MFCLNAGGIPALLFSQSHPKQNYCYPFSYNDDIKTTAIVDSKDQFAIITGKRDFNNIKVISAKPG